MERFSERGQGMAEYGLIIGLISIATVGGLTILGAGTLAMYLGNLATLFGAL